MPFLPSNSCLLHLDFLLLHGSFRQVIGDTYGYDKATVSRIVRKVSLALANKHGQWIKFPTTMEDKNTIRAGMYDIAGFLRVIGCIDGTM